MKKMGKEFSSLSFFLTHHSVVLKEEVYIICCTCIYQMIIFYLMPHIQLHFEFANKCLIKLLNIDTFNNEYYLLVRE